MTPARAVEVAAVFEDSVIKVSHLTDPRPPAANERITHILLGGGALALMGALGTFIASVHQISVARLAHDAAVAARQASGPFYLGSGGQWLDFVVAVCLIAGTWAILHGLGRWVAARRSRDFTVGPSPRADVNVPLPEDRPLVTATDTGWQMNGATITPDTRECVDFGSLRIIVAGTDAPAKLPNALRINWMQEAYMGGVALAAGLFLGLLYLIPPDAKTLALDTIHSDFVAHYIIKAPEPPDAPMKKTGPVGGGGGAAHAGPAGSSGIKTAPRQHAAIKIKGTSPDERVGRAAAEKAASQTGIVAILGDAEQSHIGSIFTRESALGHDAEDSFGDMRATIGGNSWGTGLDLLGAGPGGGGHSTTTIGVNGDDLRTIGPGGPGRKNGYPPTGAVALRNHRPGPIEGFEPPKITKGEGLTKDIIKRVVHFHHNEIKFCYEKRLAVKATLGGGRILAGFVIAGNGRVITSSIEATTLNDADVEACIAQAVKRWEFPKPSDSSMVSVVYPFVLQAPTQ